MANQPNKFVSVLLAAIAGVIGSGIFFLVGAVIASVLAASLHISPMEGARGYFAVLSGSSQACSVLSPVWLVLRAECTVCRWRLAGVTAFAILLAAAGSVLGI